MSRIVFIFVAAAGLGCGLESERAFRPKASMQTTPKQRASLVFLLSPANLSGRRAKVLLNPRATFDLATRLRSTGASLGEVFSFISGLYFRGKLAYASKFGEAVTDQNSAVLIITATRGLLVPSTVITPEDLDEMSSVPIRNAEPRYRLPLERDAMSLASRLSRDQKIVLLGSVATSKYLEPLSNIFGNRLLIPAEFVGLGDMSRGSLLLQAARTGNQMPYIGVPGPGFLSIKRGAKKADPSEQPDNRSRRHKRFPIVPSPTV
jgi:hypothetical protein